METLEKVYISPELDRRWYYPEKVGCYDTEYIRTDAFIEKAWDWIEDNILSSNLQDKSLLYYEQFKKCMKGE